jgi:hypothetical protein
MPEAKTALSRITQAIRQEIAALRDTVSRDLGSDLIPARTPSMCLEPKDLKEFLQQFESRGVRFAAIGPPKVDLGYIA